MQFLPTRCRPFLYAIHRVYVVIQKGTYRDLLSVQLLGITHSIWILHLTQFFVL